MRTMLISFKPEVFDTIVSGEKIYEHRHVFPDEPVKAYIYVSRPVQAMMGIVYLGNRVCLTEWLDKYSYDDAAVDRIKEYMKRYKVVMEIQKFQNTSKIPLSEIKKEFPNFIIPQMYYYLDDLPLLEYLENNLTLEGPTLTHEFSEISSDLICVH